MATTASILSQFLPVEYILEHLTPRILPFCLRLFFSDRGITKTHSQSIPVDLQRVLNVNSTLSIRGISVFQVFHKEVLLMLSYLTAVEEQRTVCTASEGELLVLEILKSLFTCLLFIYFFFYNLGQTVLIF